MEIYLLRHTTPFIEKGICYGQSNIDVDDNFYNEANDILQKVNQLTIQKVVSSPLKRCLALANFINLPYTSNPAYKEINFGDWELKAWNQIPEEEINPWMQNFVTTPATNGESYIDLFNRCIPEIKKETNQTLIITHAGIIRAILAHCTNTPLTDSFNFKIPYGALIKIDLKLNTYEIL